MAEKTIDTPRQGMSECFHCGYKWYSRIATKPKACPRCKSYKWSEVKN